MQLCTRNEAFWWRSGPLKKLKNLAVRKVAFARKVSRPRERCAKGGAKGRFSFGCGGFARERKTTFRTTFRTPFSHVTYLSHTFCTPFSRATMNTQSGSLALRMRPKWGQSMPNALKYLSWHRAMPWGGTLACCCHLRNYLSMDNCCFPPLFGYFEAKKKSI